MPEWYAEHPKANLDDPQNLSYLCSRGICPYNADSFSECPVMSLCGKSCYEIRLEDWVRWTESQKHDF